MKNDRLAIVVTAAVAAVAGAAVLAKHVSLNFSIQPDLVAGYGIVGAMLAIAAMDYRVALRKFLKR